MKDTATLFGIRYSPWTLRARWALDHHHVPYRYREYLPLLGVPELRVRLRAWSGKVTAPALVGPDIRLADSTAIARWAESGSTAEPLFDASDEVIETWTTVAEELSSAGRVLSTLATARDREAVQDNIPAFVPGPVRPVAGPMVHTGLLYLSRKYGFSKKDVSEAERRMRVALEQIANRLTTDPWLGDAFSWADIAVVCALQFVEPATGWVDLGPGAARAWTRESLAADFSDVLAWRDEALRSQLP